MKNYYNDNAKAFFEATVDVDMTPLYQRFLPLLPPNASILDAGCGSGRDSLHFIKQGYSVTAIDASQPLCDMATELLGQNVACMDFDAIDWKCEFDGIWACASLLHVERSKLNATTQAISDALKPSGVLYASFKYGSTERTKDGRTFTDMDEHLIEMLFDNVSGITLEEMWVTEDRRVTNENKWINILARKNLKP